MFTLAILLFGCRDEARKGQSQRADSVPSSASLAAAPGPLTRSGLARALSALQQRAGNSPALLAVELLADRATFQVASTLEPRKLEQYEWQAGELAGPFSVEVRGSGSLEQNLFAFSVVDWTSIPDLLNSARSHVDLELGRVTKVVVRRKLPQDEAVAIRVYVDSPVRSGYVDADARGKLLEPPRSP